MFGIAVCIIIDYHMRCNPSLLPPMPAFRSDDSFSRDLHEAFAAGPRLRRLVRAAANIRILLLGTPGRSGAPSGSARPVATGTFSFPAFGCN